MRGSSCQNTDMSASGLYVIVCGHYSYCFTSTMRLMDYLKISEKSWHVDKAPGELNDTKKDHNKHFNVQQEHPSGCLAHGNVYAMVMLALTSVTVVRYHGVVNMHSARNKKGNQQN